MASSTGLGLIRAIGACVAAGSIVAGTQAQQIGHTSMEVRTPAAPVPAVALGRTHLVYEVHITNFSTHPATIDRLEVLDEAGVALGAWSGIPLSQRVMVLGRMAGDPVILAAGTRAVAFLWLTIDPARRPPSSLVHHLTLLTSSGARSAITAAPVVVSATPGAPMAAPVADGSWVAVRGPSPANGHRLSLVALDGTVRVPQRFAVDWARLGDDGRLFGNKGRDVTDWFSYDAPVIAVADGTVALIREGMADTTPRSTPPATVEAKDAPGNVVVIDLGNGCFATYAHLKAGSVRVKEGERVRAGQVLAHIGNSGNSMGPHLHFHVSDAIEPLGGEGLPFSLDRFELIGRVPGLGPLLAGTPWMPQANRPARTVTAEMPLENMVVRFKNQTSRRQ